MCGIVGILDPRRRRGSEESSRLIDRLSEPLRVRGPDGSGSWVDESAGIALGHRRLSVLDLSEAGSQPMVSADGRYVITYNGEIYDHPDLSDRLRGAGVQLRGHSDTEVLLEGIATFGLDDTLDRVDGMFAFALWDRAQRSLTLVRDRLGEKPLYVATLGTGEIVFASTLDAIRAHPDFDLRVDRDALALYLRHKYVPAPWSIYSGAAKVEPGCTVTIDADGSIGSTQPYWSYYDVVARGSRFDGTPEEAVDELDRLLRRSVRRRLVADVPVGAFLSGGIDSSLIVAIAQSESSSPVRTFTIGSDSAAYDESSDARRVADHLGTDHTELIVSDGDALATAQRMAGIWDEPFGDSSQVPTTLVSELARRDVTVALSGDAGDELFLGYNRYVWVPAIWDRLASVPVPARRVGATALGSVPPTWWDRAARVLPERRRPRHLGMKVAKVASIADAPTAQDVFHRLTSHWQDPGELVVGATEPPTAHTDPSSWPATEGIVEHMAAVDAVTYLPDDILTKVDRATMSVSLEGRVPLLDRSIVEFAASLPVDVRMRDGRSKWPLRSLLERSLPAQLFERPKSGFGVPIESWLAGPLRDWAEHHLSGPAVAGFLRPAPLRRAWSEQLSGRRNHAYALWDVVMFAAWCEERGVTG